MPRSSTPTDPEGSSGENSDPQSRRRGSSQHTFLNYPGQGGALLPGVLQHMRDDMSPTGTKRRPSHMETFRAADMKFVRNAVAALFRPIGALRRRLGVRFLWWLDRILTVPSQRSDAPPPGP